MRSPDFLVSRTAISLRLFVSLFYSSHLFRVNGRTNVALVSKTGQSRIEYIKVQSFEVPRIIRLYVLVIYGS